MAQKRTSAVKADTRKKKDQRVDGPKVSLSQTQQVNLSTGSDKAFAYNYVNRGSD